MDDQAIEDELDAAFAALGVASHFSQAVLEGVAALRPMLVGELPGRAAISVERLAAATSGQLELDGDELRRIEDAVDLPCLTLATAHFPPAENGDGLGALFMASVESDRRRFQAERGTPATTAD